MTVVRTTAHPWAVDGLIGWKMAIRVLLWCHMAIEWHGCSVDPLGIQRGQMSPSRHVTTLRISTGSDFSPFPSKAGNLIAPHLPPGGSRLRGCVRFNYGHCVSGQGHFEVGEGLGLILVGFIAVLSLIITDCGGLFVARTHGGSFHQSFQVSTYLTSSSPLFQLCLEFWFTSNFRQHSCC